MTRQLCFLIALSLIGTAGIATAQVPDAARVLAEGVQLEDARLNPPKDLNGYFPFIVPNTVEEWEQRSAALKQRILVATGLWPLPEKTPLNAVVHGRVERDGFTVERVYFESLPGLFVTGSLFRPVGEGPFPGVLCPHGHGGRLQDAGEEKIRWQIVRGEERFEASGRFPKIARCAQLARMGCVTFMHDMMGYGDNHQLSYELVHRHAKARPEMEGKDEWGFFSAQAEMRAQSVMGLQTWNTIRSLDFLCSLPDVDTTRIGVTGNSGGGTQTIVACAIDERPIVAFPQGMVSTAMQGGCTCENVNLLRIGTGNVELAALFAPKPQAMTAADDWTIDMMTLGYPELRALYAMLGKQDNVECTSLVHFPHNFNFVSRALMYMWVNKHLKLGLKEPIVEEDFEMLTVDRDLTVWTDEHPAPTETDEILEKRLTKYLADQSDAQLAALAPHDLASLDQYRSVVGAALETIIGRTLKDVGAVTRERVEKVDRGDHWLFKDLITMTAHQESLPAISLYPKAVDWTGRVVVWVTGSGKAGLFAEDGFLRPEVKAVIDRGDAVVTADLLAQGEWISEELPGDANRVVKNPREYAGYTFTYNHTLFAQRVHDILSLIAWIQHDEHIVKNIVLAGSDGAGPLAAAAAAVSDEALSGVAVSLNGFHFAGISDYRDQNFLPNIVKYGDVPGLLALLTADRVLVVDSSSNAPELVEKSFQARPEAHLDWEETGANPAQQLSNWLLDR